MKTASKLFLAAIGNLTTAERGAVEAVNDRLAACVGVHRACRVDGDRLVTNIRNETRLNGDAGHADSAVMTSFLRRWSEGAITTDDGALLASYEAVSAEFAHRGLDVNRDCLPDEILRYTINRRLVSLMIRRVLGVTAQIDFDSGRLEAAEAFSDLERFWRAGDASGDEQLATTPTVFATFEDGAAPVDRDEASAVANALALPVTLFDRRDGIFLYELAYTKDSISEIRFPTVADAGAIYLFKPCEDIPPHSLHPRGCFGYTEALEGEFNQPEIVHANASLRVLTGPPRLVGSLDD